MAPSPIPAPLPPWARTLLQLAPFISAGLQAALQYIGELHDVTATVPTEWRRASLNAELITNTSSRDRYITTLDVVKMTSGGADPNWTDSDHNTLTGQVSDMAAAWAPYMWSQCRFTRIDLHRMQFNPIISPGPVPPEKRPPPLAPTGPPIVSTPFTYVGTAAGATAPQVAATTTDRTTYARHWGRNYWPCPTSGSLTSTGHFGVGMVDGFGTALHDIYATLMAAQLFPVTVVTQIQGGEARGLLTTTALQMDDVPDVVRRRRPSQTTHRLTLPLG